MGLDRMRCFESEPPFFLGSLLTVLTRDGGQTPGLDQTWIRAQTWIRTVLSPHWDVSSRLNVLMDTAWCVSISGTC